MRLEDFEKYLQKRLKDQKAYDLDPSSIWANVEPELSKEEKRPFYSWWAMFSVFIFLILSSLIFLNKDSVFFPNSPKKSADLNTSRAPDPPLMRASASDTISREYNSIINTTINKKTQNLEQEKSKKRKVSIIPSLKTKSSKVILKSTTTHYPVLRNKPHIDTKSILPLEKLDFNLLSSTSFLVDSSFNLVHPQKQKLEKHLFLLAELGPAYSLLGLTFQQNEAYGQLRKDTETPLLGWQTSLALFFPISKKLTLGTGINYNKTNFKFYFENERTDQLILPNMPLNILIDTPTQDTVGIHYGNAELDSTTLQKVQHYNDLTSLSIPIYVGLFKSKKSFKYGILAGINYQFNLKQNGKILNKEANIINMQEQAYFKKSGFALLIKPILMYSIGKNTAITISPSFQFDLSNKVRKEYSIVQKPMHFNLSLGVQKRLDL